MSRARLPKAPKMGRPPLAKSVVRINMKADKKDRDAWQALADREDMTLSEFMRAAADLAVARGSTR